MPEDLRKQLAQQQMQSQQHPSTGKRDWNEGFRLAMEAHAAGYRTPEPRYPVIIDKKSAIGSAEALQRILGLPLTPTVIDTFTNDQDLEPCPIPKDRIQICELNYNQLKLLEKVADIERHYCHVIFQDIRRFATWVFRLKESGVKETVVPDKFA